MSVLLIIFNQTFNHKKAVKKIEIDGCRKFAESFAIQKEKSAKSKYIGQNYTLGVSKIINQGIFSSVELLSSQRK